MKKFLILFCVFTLIFGLGVTSVYAAAEADARKCANGRDDDKDGLIDCDDPDCAAFCGGGSCTDNDGDGYGNPASTDCTYAELDCDDDNSAINPGAAEIQCDGIDQDCSGADDCTTGSCPDNPLNHDHTGKNDLQGPFTDAIDVVSTTCTQCHSNKARNVAASTHHAWDNKNLQVNNFCTIAMPNAHCIKCHPSFDKVYNDYSQSLSNDMIDCLVCHASDYERVVNPDHTTGGNITAGGKTWADIAMGVGYKVTKAQCLRCHAGAGGGNKQGDLGASLATADANLDVHMGNCMECVDCHAWDKHQVAGAGTQHPTGTNRMACADCHSESDITANGLHANGHYNWMACQTCHIPEFAKADTTNTNWNYDVSGFTLQKLTNLSPVYKWWDGTSTVNFDLLADTVNTGGTTVLAGPNEAAKPSNPPNQTAIKAYPFYEHPGANAYDASSNKIMPFYRNSSCGVIDSPNNRSWNESIWNCAINLAVADWNAAGHNMSYSGNLGFTSTVMYLNLNHEVTRANALTCTDCHQTASGGSSNRNTNWGGWTDLGY